MILPKSDISIKAVDCNGRTTSQIELQFPSGIIILIDWDAKKGKIRTKARLLGQDAQNIFTAKSKNDALKIKHAKGGRKNRRKSKNAT